MAKALSVRQPWAWAVIKADEDVENRPKPTRYRGPLYIHDGKQDALAGWQFLDELGVRLPVDPPTGGIVGLVDLVDCVEDSKSRWAFAGEYHWVLRNPRPVPFVPLAGQLGIFNVEL